MSELLTYSNQINTIRRFCQLVFVDVVIWVSVESSIHYLPGVVICAVTSWTTLTCMFYLVTVEVVFVSGNHHLPAGIMFIRYIWLSSSHTNIVGIFGQLVVGVAIWAPVNPSIHFFTRLVMRM